MTERQAQGQRPGGLTRSIPWLVGALLVLVAIATTQAASAGTDESGCILRIWESWEQVGDYLVPTGHARVDCTGYPEGTDITISEETTGVLLKECLNTTECSVTFTPQAGWNYVEIYYSPGVWKVIGVYFEPMPPMYAGPPTTTTTSTVPPPTGDDRFRDDNGNIHERNIEAIAADGITKGCNPPTNDRYCPNDPLSRGQMAAFIRRAFGLPASNTDYFTDDSDSIFEADINALAEAGITKGCNPPAADRFCPDGRITRGQMAAFLRRAFGYPAAGTDFFNDDTASIFEGDINAIARVGVTLGCNPPANDRYCPGNLVKRDQMASFFARALGL